ncbi:MAG: YafY family transcriptional regulator [Rhodothermaceae bacterium TMED105]|nr:MAG: YafY family transcriptional regulator [Rhodothermaceae bacterium TMED105]|tara:strand:+ start:678 stop:1622 length:945 start_codon:yes stop_codon:yes gene_type:complete
MKDLNSTERVMKMFSLMQSSTKRLTVNELATLFGVSRRTIFRDLNKLEAIGLPITHDPVEGYGVMKEFRIPPIQFNPKELSTLMVGIQFVKAQVNQSLSEDATMVESKIRQVINPELRAFMDLMAERMIIDPSMTFQSEKQKGGDWYTLSGAIASQKTITFSYRNKKGITEDRKVDPYLLVFYTDHWNLIGYSHERESIRNYILEKVTNLVVTDENYAPKVKLDARALIFDSESTETMVEVYVHSKALKRFSANLPTKIIKSNPESAKMIKVTFGFDNLDYLNEWLLQFGADVKVIGPKELVTKRQELLHKMIS